MKTGSISKIKVSILGEETTYEIGKKYVKSIHLDENGLVEIKYEGDSEWDSKLIPIQSVESFNILWKRINIDPRVRSSR